MKRTLLKNHTNSFSQFTKVASLVFLWIAIPTLSLAQSLPAVPNVITQASFAVWDKTYTLEVESGTGSKVREGGLYCANLDRTPELDCANCSLVLKLQQKELSRIALGYASFVLNQGKWQVTGSPPLSTFARTAQFPLISFSQYVGCNGNTHHLYWIEEAQTQTGLPTLKPIKLLGFEPKSAENALYASAYEGIRLLKTPRYYELRASGYDNSRFGAFLVQFGEFTPGQWECIGFYTQISGVYEEMLKRRLLK